MHDWQENAWIWSKNGNKLSILHLKPSDVEIDEIAHALANTCRFGGHCGKFYSVAEHSLIMAHLIIELEGDCNQCGRDLALSALLHDASEYMLTDVPKPFKHMMPEYEKYEKFISGIIDERFGTNSKHPLLKTLDKRLVISEAIALWESNGIPDWIREWPVDAIDNFDKYLNCYDPNEAYFAFMEMFIHLTVDNRKELVYD